MQAANRTPEDAPRRRWGPGQRLEFIEFRAFWEGGVNRGDLQGRFGVSAPQASADLSDYMAAAPGNLAYDASAKRYVATPGFEPRLTRPSAERYLAQLGALREGLIARSDAPVGFRPDVETLPLPGRKLDAGVLRALVAAIREQASVEVRYQSMSDRRPDPQWRRLSPHAFASDGLRWHVRAFCHEDRLFKDFVLPRLTSARSQGPGGARQAADADWNIVVPVHLIANPRLSPAQREAVADDYAMVDGRLALPVRRALLYYLKKRLRLDVQTDRPGETPVVLADPAAFDAALAAASGEASAAQTS